MSGRRVATDMRRGALLVALLAAALPGQAGAGPTAGSLRFVDAYTDGRPGVQGIAGVSGVAVSPDSRHVYVTGVERDSIAVFRRTGGGLAFVEAHRDGESEGGTTIHGLDGAAAVAVSPDGENVYVASTRDGAVATFARRERNGKLRFTDLERDSIGGVDGIAGARGLAVSPDGESVYVAGFDDGAVASFARDPAGGELGFLEFDQFDDLGGAFSVAVAPDSAAVYVAAFTTWRVIALRRDRATGTLELASTSEDVLWPRGPVSIAPSAYGRDVYVAALRDSALNRFRRSTPDQALAFTGFVKEGLAGTRGIRKASGVVISPEATHAYVTGAGADALASFSVRDRTGELRYRARYRHGRRGVHGLNDPVGVAIAPDGRRVYTIANGGVRDTLAVFARRPTPLLTPVLARDEQHLRDLKVVVGCSRSCRLTARARGRTAELRFSSGRVSAALTDDRKHRVKLRFHRAVLRRLRGQPADITIVLKARDRLDTSVTRKLAVEIVP